MGIRRSFDARHKQEFSHSELSVKKKRFVERKDNKNGSGGLRNEGVNPAPSSAQCGRASSLQYGKVGMGGQMRKIDTTENVG